MKVMHLLSSLKHEDSERGIYPISHSLIKQGHRSLLVAGANIDDELVVRLTRDGSVFYPIAMPKKSWWALRHRYRLAKLINSYRPDVIHVHSRTPAWVLHFALKNTRYRPKILTTFYGFYPLNHYSKALFHTDSIITASKSIDGYLKQKLIALDIAFDPERIVCIPRGVDARTYPYRHKPSVHWLQHVFAEFPTLEHKQWLIFPTPIDHEHGQEWLIDIIGNLRQNFPKLHILIMDNPQNNELPQSVQVIYDDFYQRLNALELSDFVTFIGKKPNDTKDWLSSAQIVLALATRPESIGITALQAIHLGTPVIGWNQGAFGDILSDLYPRGLIKEQNAKALCQAIASQLETGVRPAITHEYEIDTMIQNTLALYKQLSNQPPNSA